MDTALGWLQATTVAGTVRDSIQITAVLSALHALGFTLIMGGALFANLGLLRLLFPNRPVRELTGPGSLVMTAGLALSLPTGLLLFAPRALVAGHNPVFGAKMLLLLSAAGVQFLLQSRGTRAVGAASLALWVGVAAAACAFILLE